MGVRPLIRRARVVFRRMSADENDDISLDQHPDNSDSKVRPTPSYTSSAACGEIPDGSAQHGVQDVEAVTMAWSKKTLIAVFIKYVSLVVCRVSNFSLFRQALTSSFTQHLVFVLRKCVSINGHRNPQSLCDKLVSETLVVCSPHRAG